MFFHGCSPLYRGVSFPTSINNSLPYTTQGAQKSVSKKNFNARSKTLLLVLYAQGDAVLALSNIPGRGWMMGAVTARGSNGRYTIAFADGTESDEVRYADLEYKNSRSDEGG